MVEDINGVFSPLGQLWKLSLAHNRIKSINQKAFIGLSHVTELDLTGNNVTTIQENAFLPMSSLIKLKMNTRKFKFYTLYTNKIYKSFYLIIYTLHYIFVIYSYL